MRRLALALGICAACTTVVQEPPDLDPGKVEQLTLLPDPEGVVRVRSPEAWADPGPIFLWNRLTAEHVEAVIDEVGVLDAEVPGVERDAFAVSRVAADDAPRQFVLGDGGRTLSAWAWGFVDAEGNCARGELHGEVGPAHGGEADTHRNCVAAAVPGVIYDDAWSVFADRVRIELRDAPVLRFWVQGHVDGDVHVLVLAGGREYHAARSLLGLVAQAGVTLRFERAELTDDGGDPLPNGSIVEQIWIYVRGAHAEQFQLVVDDVVFESAAAH